ncbi:MAG: hypothetical protein ABW098_20860 [Candidatus Thiodiazotropha sp.]
MKEPDLLSTAINSIATDGSLTQQQQPTPQTYYYHPQQSLPQQTHPQVSQPKTGAVEVLLKELNDLKKRVQQLEDQKQHRPMELNAVRIPLTIEIMTTETSVTVPNGMGMHSKNIDNSKRKKKQ